MNAKIEKIKKTIDVLRIRKDEISKQLHELETEVNTFEEAKLQKRKDFLFGVLSREFIDAACPEHSFNKREEKCSDHNTCNEEWCSRCALLRIFETGVWLPEYEFELNVVYRPKP